MSVEQIPPSGPAPTKEPFSIRVTRQTMLILIVAFLAADILFLFFSGPIYTAMRWTGALFGLSMLRWSGDLFYVLLTNSMMLMLVFACWQVWRDPVANRMWLALIVFSKLVSSGGGLLAFFATEPYYHYLAITLSDLPIAVICLVLYLRLEAET